MGLYFNFSIALLYILIIAIYMIIKQILKYNNLKKKEFKLLSLKRYFRYIKLILNSKIIFVIIIFSIISNSIVIFQNKKYENLYKNQENLNGIAVVIGNKQEKEYSNIYKIKYKQTYLYLKVNKKSTIDLKYGDKISFSGNFIEPAQKRNFRGFNYKEYLKTLKVFGTVKAEEIDIIEKNSGNVIFRYANIVSEKIKEKIDSNLEKNEADILKRILLGDTEQIEEDIQEKFRISSISHILAVSGMHVAYLITGINLLLKSKVGKRKIRFITIIFLIFYTFITGFSPSIARASIMGILVIGSGILYRKNDTWTSIALSLLCILIYNPFLITNIGLQFSYLGTIGIILFHKNVFLFLKNIKIKNRKWKYRINRKIILIIGKIKEILAVTISAQLAILPVSIYHFNLFSSYFFLTNLLVSVIIGPIIILGVIAIILSFVFMPIAKIAFGVLEFLIRILILISNLSKLPFSKLYLTTPQIWQVILIYLLIIILNFIYVLYHQKILNITQIRVRNLIALLKYKIHLNKKKYVKFLTVIILTVLLIGKCPKKLKIHFVDVGQGDSTFITTPKNKTILIDGGGSESKDLNVGKSTLLPYILDRGYKKIDYIFISHFDQDHVEGLLYVIKEIKVKNVVIGKQFEESENLKEFLRIVKEKNIKVSVVEAGDRVKIEKDLYFDVLWPDSKNKISDNILNNNSLVCKLYYKSFSMLFTGDI